jgi:magnesium chelatase family protein
VTRIESLAGVRVRGLRDRPPFRAPHHSITAAGLIGGGRSDAAGEAVLAHNGVLFLDELSEFQRATLQALRQPLEEGRVVISRARHRAAYPSRFMLLAATNPCPCGFAGEHERCTCTDAELVLHRRRIGGPLLDRIDLFAALVREHGTSGRAAPTTSSADAHEQILEARARQRHRLRGEPVALNGHLDASVLERHLDLEDGGRELVRRAGSAGLLSARGQHRVLRVARTIADLAGRDRVCARHVGAALALRPHASDGREDGR